MPSRIADPIVRAAPLPPTVQARLAGQSRWQQSLAWNPHLTASVVQGMYTPKVRANVAAGLVSRPLDDETLELVVRTRAESRSAVVKQLWRHNRLSEDLAAVLAANGIGITAADTVVRDADAPLAGRVAFLTQASGSAGLDFLEAHAGTAPDTVVADVVVTALRSGYPKRLDDHMTNPRMKKALRVLALHPGAVALVAAQAGTHASVALAVAPFRLEESSARTVIDAVSSLATPGWGVPTAFVALSMLIDRPDAAPAIVELASRRLWVVPNGNRARYTHRLGRGHDPYRELPRSEVPIRDAEDPDALEDWVSGREWRCHGFTGWQHLRAFQYADLALNEHLGPAQARHVADVLCRREVRAELGSHLVRARCEVLRERHPRSVRRLPALPAPRGKRDRTVQWAPDPSPAGELAVFELWHPARAAQAGEHLAEHLGDDPDRWDVLLGLVETFHGTLDDLVEVVEHVSAP